MKPVELIIWLSLLFPLILIAQSNIDFDDFFIDQTMRIDYFHIGDAKYEIITLDQIYQYGIWAGSRKNLVDQLNNGKYYAKVYDIDSGKLLFSKGFDTYFAEYQASSQALDSIKRTYHESVLIPAPLKSVNFVLEKRDRQNLLYEIFKTKIDPNSVDIVKKNFKDKSIKILNSYQSGDPHTKVDIAILAEGYTREQEEKFATDVERFTQIFLAQEPYHSFKSKFNIYGVFRPSEESGVNEPRAGIFKNTVLDVTFNSLGSERYLMTENNKALRDLAANVPYDALFIMVNHKRYGGGGIYNLFCTFTSDNQFHEYLFLHEFGHSFAGLADEYYTSETAYNEFFPRGIEPVEPNITALLDPENIKWKALLTPGIELPTPWEKEGYDAMDYPWQEQRRALNKKIAELKRSNADLSEIKKAEEEYIRSDKKHNHEVDHYLHKSHYWGKVGAFEGAGYSSEGLYRPMLDCIMFSKGSKPFCKVCEKAIIRAINYYTE